MINVDRLLYIDTETDPDTQGIDCVTWRYEHRHGIIEEFTEETYVFLQDMWNACDGVVMFNAPFDIGVLSKAWEYNGYKWVDYMRDDIRQAYWLVKLFGQGYKVKRLSSKRNLISPTKRKHVVPIIDLLKLWSILIQESGIGLKALIKNELGHEPIPWSKEIAYTDAYRYQDVDELRNLMVVFLEKIDGIEDLKYYTCEEWGFVKTPATFSKLAYEKFYEFLGDWKDENDERVAEFDALSYGLEHAYHGGLTFSFYRGDVPNTGWVDIKGAYSKAMEVLNTDQYLKFDIEETKDFDMDAPYLLKVKSNFIMEEVAGGLKVYYIRKHQVNWVWNYDIAAINNLIPDYKYKVLQGFKILPKSPTDLSLPVHWNALKDVEKGENGKSTLYYFYKFLSNTSYGIKAQRRPFETRHTNLAIAGMITSRVHMVLTGINKVLRDNGYRVLYNDTDSACFEFIPSKGDYKVDLTILDKINEGIAPFEVDFEGFYEYTRVLSLKRYISSNSDVFAIENQVSIGEVPTDKVKIHGKSIYDISHEDMRSYVLSRYTRKSSALEASFSDKLNIHQFGGNTERGIKRILSRFPEYADNQRPFMFVTDLDSDATKGEFLMRWFKHCDCKLSVNHETGWNFDRSFRVFNTQREAVDIFSHEAAHPGEGMKYDNEMSGYERPDAFEETLSEASIEALEGVTTYTNKENKYIWDGVMRNCTVCGAMLYPGKNIAPSRYRKGSRKCKTCMPISPSRIAPKKPSPKKTSPKKAPPKKTASKKDSSKKKSYYTPKKSWKVTLQEEMNKDLADKRRISAESFKIYIIHASEFNTIELPFFTTDWYQSYINSIV